MTQEEFTAQMERYKARYTDEDLALRISVKGAIAFTARMCTMYPDLAKEWYDSLPKATMDGYLKATPAERRKYDLSVEQDIIALIESRIGEIMGDAQPKPALRAELQELIKKIRYDTKTD